MTQAASASAASEPPSPRLGAEWGLYWLGAGALSAPVLYENYRQNWSLEQGQAAPIVLALGLWLLWRRWGWMRDAAQASSPWASLVAGLLLALAYVGGRVADQYLLESYALYGAGLLSVYALYGWRSLRRGLFPFGYLLFALPVPYTVTWALTSHLRLWLTQGVVQVWRTMGFNVVRDGLNILVDQYELAVQDACSGMNSLFSLSAIGFLYVYLRRAPPAWYYAFVAAPIVLFAVAGNFSRILFLVALTHYFGDAVAQSYLHETAGLVTFAVALAGVIGVDGLASALLLQPRKAV
ncbi:MAG: exosortase/archaeosortase family protein [Caulobacteraceae bacterium]|nr:exosortase/archaeosortase family protein [Caulobacteraceae bacterium]